MDTKERRKLISNLEEERKTRVIVYVTSTRPGLETQMALDQISKIYEHLRLIKTSAGSKELNIDLFLVSNGGDGTVPWRLVTLIREYAKTFSVLIPSRAFSAATLTALGADCIIMHPMGMLGPTDPTIIGPFNPDDKQHPGQKLGISVEDVTAYITLIKEDAGITHEDELVQAFNQLTANGNIHPLALGAVKRSILQSKMMAEKLLSLHMNQSKEQHNITEIVENLTSKLFYHGHPINRKEARDPLGIKTVEDASPTVETLMWDLYSAYVGEMKLEIPFDIAMEFQAKMSASIQPNTPTITPVDTAKVVYIESVDRTDVFSIDYQINGMMTLTGETTNNLLFKRREWVAEN